jgi:hypothetical protein
MSHDYGERTVARAAPVWGASGFQRARVLLQDLNEKLDVTLVCAVPEFVMRIRVASRNLPLVNSLFAQRFRKPDFFDASVSVVGRTNSARLSRKICADAFFRLCSMRLRGCSHSSLLFVTI